MAISQAQGRHEIKNSDFTDRLTASAAAKKLQLERAAQARSLADNPAAVERRAARGAISVARDVRVAERKATKAAREAREAAERDAAQAAEAAAQAAALKAEHEAREAEYTQRMERQAALEAEQLAARDARYAARKAKKRNGR